MEPSRQRRAARSWSLETFEGPATDHTGANLMGHTSQSGRRASVLLLLILLLPSSLSAQGKSHVHVSLGAGATHLNGGLKWVIGRGPIGIGGEVGAGWVSLAAITGSYHFLGRRPRKHDLFATVGYAGLGSSEFSSQGVTVGGGGTYWPAVRLGLRFDAFRFLPVATDNNIPARRAFSVPVLGCASGHCISLSLRPPNSNSGTSGGSTSNLGLQPATTDATMSRRG
jgi:hypothetical protein